MFRKNGKKIFKYIKEIYITLLILKLPRILSKKIIITLTIDIDKIFPALKFRLIMKNFKIKYVMVNKSNESTNL